jgi:predicted deacylase
MRRLAAILSVLAGGCVLPRPIDRSPAAAAEPADHATAARAPAAAAAAAPTAEVAWQTFGWSTEGRPLRLRRVGHGPRRVVWVGGIHGDEREARAATAALPAAVAGVPGLAEAVTLTIVEDANPDGSAAGRRGNARGVDLNRNFPATNFAAGEQTGERPLDQPEARALHDILVRLAPDLVLVAHSTRGAPFVNWDGPAEVQARLFAEAASCELVASDRLHPTPGSLGTWLGRERNVSVLTIEYRRGEDPEAAWQRTRAAILAAIAGAVPR